MDFQSAGVCWLVFRINAQQIPADSSRFGSLVPSQSAGICWNLLESAQSAQSAVIITKSAWYLQKRIMCASLLHKLADCGCKNSLLLLSCYMMVQPSNTGSTWGMIIATIIVICSRIQSTIIIWSLLSLSAHIYTLLSISSQDCTWLSCYLFIIMHYFQY